VLGGCGFHSSPEVADGGAANGSSAPANCFQRWFDGAPSLAFSAPPQLTALAADADIRDPWISADGLRLYFNRNPSTAHGKADIYLAQRGSTAVDFPTASAVDNLDTNENDVRVSLNRDETLLVLSSDRAMPGKFQIFVTTRGDTTQPFPTPSGSVQALVASVNTTNNSYFDPFLTPDGLTLYLAPILTGSPQQITRVTRATGQDFGPSTAVAVINSGKGDADPAVSPDERVIVFSSMRPSGVSGLGATNLWYATRQNATDDFTTPKLIPMVNSNSEDGDPMLSADGCELYFASRRAPGGKYQLFHAQVMK
jgi:Tol biopolymer transport system component